MQGIITWWSGTKGVCSVIKNGQGKRFFLLSSRIQSAPEVIKRGQYVRFDTSIPGLRPDLLPVAVGVVISEKPFEIESGIAALNVEVRS